MSLDLIKQYLIGIGFNVDENSLKTAKESMSQADDSIKKFNDESNKGFSETSNSLKNLFALFTSSPTILKAIPGLGGPFKNIIKDISMAQKAYKEFKDSVEQKISGTTEDGKTKSVKKKKENNIPKTDNSKNQPKVQRIKDDNTKKSQTKQTIDLSNVIKNSKEAKKQITEFASDTGNKLKEVEAVSEGLLSKGGTALKAFASTGVGALTLIVGAVALTVTAVKKLSSYLNDLANQDIGYEKLSRQLWTTKENAKEISSALDILDADLNDLWLSPTLLKQFNQLKQDSKDLKLPAEFNQNLKSVQGLSLEFKRLKQMVGLFFQWIGNYILKYAKGPIDDLKKSLHNGNEWLKQAIPVIAKSIGTVIGLLIKIISIIIKIIGFVGKLLLPLKAIFNFIGKIKDSFENAPEPIKKMLKVLMLLLNPLVLVIALIDDIITYFKGGESVIGSFINKVTSKSETAGKVIKGILKALSAILTGGLSLVPWDKYWKKAKETFEKIKNKAKETYEKIREWSKNKLEQAKEFITGANDKMNNFNESVINNTTASYVTSNKSNTDNSVTTSNSNNKVVNNNNINVYGSGDAKSTAKSTADTLTGINTRNLQPVF